MNVKLIKNLIFCLCLILMMSTVNAQGTWKVYTKDDGLKANKITDIFKDSRGNLWFNTYLNGIIKFDGNDWTNYYNKNNLILVSVIFEDSKGTVWLGAQSAKYPLARGIWKVNGSSYKRISKIGTMFIIEDSNGLIWFGYKKLCSYNGNSVTEYTKKEIGDKKTTSCYFDHKGCIWVGTESGVSEYDGETWRKFSNQPDCPTKSVYSIISDSDGNYWFGAEDGVFKYDGVDWKHYSIKDGIVADETIMIRIDVHNNIYALAGKPEKESIGIGIVDMSRAIGYDLAKTGLSIYENNHWRAYTSKKEVPDNIRPIYIEDKSGNLWFNSKDEIIYKFDGSTWKSFNESNGFIGKHFGRILEDSKGNYWFTTGIGIAKYNGQNWSYFNKETGLPSNNISSIMEDNNGNIWFGSLKGVIKFTYE